MTAVAPRPDQGVVAPERPQPFGHGRKGSWAWEMLTTTDHKQLGIMYIIMSFSFFFARRLDGPADPRGAVPPGMQFLSNEQFNQLFTMHGTVMLLLFGTPIVWGFANFVLPLQIGAPTWHSRVSTLSASGLPRSVASSCSPASSPRAVLLTSVGRCTPRCRMPCTPRVWAPTCGSSASAPTGVGTVASAINMTHHHPHACVHRA